MPRITGSMRRHSCSTLDSAHPRRMQRDILAPDADCASQQNPRGDDPFKQATVQARSARMNVPLPKTARAIRLTGRAARPSSPPSSGMSTIRPLVSQRGNAAARRESTSTTCVKPARRIPSRTTRPQNKSAGDEHPQPKSAPVPVGRSLCGSSAGGAVSIPLPSSRASLIPKSQYF